MSVNRFAHSPSLPASSDSSDHAPDFAEANGGRQWWHDHLLAFAAGTSLLLASLVNFLLHNDYPLFRTDVAIVVGVLLLVSALLTWIYAGQRQWGKSLLEGALILLFADLNGVPLHLAALAGVAAALFTWWRQISLAGPLALFGAIVIATKLAGIGGREAWLRVQTRPDPPAPSAPAPNFAVLHLLLDEQAGVHGIYPDANGLRFREDLRQFFLSRDFALYGRAYSEHMHTVNAIPAVLNFGTRLASASTVNGATVGRTEYFERLHSRGFKLHVLQNDFADLCTGNPISTCTTYDSSSLRPTLAAPLNTLERAQLIGLKFAGISSLGAQVLAKTNKLGQLASNYGGGWAPLRPRDSSRTSTTAAFEAIKSLSQEVRRARPGEVYFAHLLMPHFPHVVRANCSYKPWAQWETTRSNYAIEHRRRTYIEQDRCTLLKVNELIRAFEQSAGGRNGVVIIHGDHGSRIFRLPPVTDQVGRFDGDDVIAAHATLFAVRGLGTTSRYDETPQAITALLRDFVASDFRSAPVPTKPMQSFVLSSRWTKVQRREGLPRQW